MDLAFGDLTDAEATRAIGYAVRAFSEGEGAGLPQNVFEKGLSAAVDRAVVRFTNLNRRIKANDLTVVFQPIVSLETHEIAHYEVLSRFTPGQSPYETIMFSEEVGLIEALDLAVCGKALAELGCMKGVRLAVNLSGRSIQSETFRAALRNLLTASEMVAHRLIFELTESSSVERVSEASAFLGELRARGHKICLDDFGAGAAAYSYLRHFEVDFVKIDGQLLRAAAAGRRNFMLVESVCRLCDDLGCETIGEMIETEEEASVARALDIGYGQGWLYCKPLASLPAWSASAAATRHPV